MRWLGVLLLLSVGCVKRASSGSEEPGASAGDERESYGVICEREHVPGSHTKRRVCRSREQRGAEREQADKALRGGSPNASPGEAR